MGKFKLPLVLFLLLVNTYYFGFLVSYEYKSIFLAISLSLKEILIFVLPFIIFSFITYSLINLKGHAFKFIILLLSCVFISNSIAIYTGYFVSNVFLANLPSIVSASSNKDVVPYSYLLIELPKLLSNKNALIFAFITGILFSYKRNNTAERFIKFCNDLSIIFLKKIFIPLLPLFIFGSVLKLEYQGILGEIFNSYGYVFLLVMITQISYVLILYLIANNFSAKKLFSCILNILPVTLTGFGTISSAASMGALIVAMEKILKKNSLYKIIVPSVINIHTIGSAIGVTIISMATIKTFGFALPPFIGFAIFALHYALQKFGVAAVPGGVICVVGPLLNEYLGFSGEMVGMVTAIYILYDPFGTACNITANGAFTMIFQRIFTAKIQTRRPIQS